MFFVQVLPVLASLVFFSLIYWDFSFHQEARHPSDISESALQRFAPPWGSPPSWSSRPEASTYDVMVQGAAEARRFEEASNDHLRYVGFPQTKRYSPLLF